MYTQRRVFDVTSETVRQSYEVKNRLTAGSRGWRSGLEISWRRADNPRRGGNQEEAPLVRMTGFESADYLTQDVGNIKVKKKKRKIQSGDYEVSEEEPKVKVTHFSRKDAERQKEQRSQLTSSQYDMENISLNNHKENRQRKKYHHKDERSLVGNVSEHEISYNIAFDNTTVDDIVNSEHTNLEEAARKKKKKKHRHKDESTLVENLLEHEISHNKNIAIHNAGGFGDHLHSEHDSLEESTRKKKKKRPHKDESTLVGNVSEHEISYNDKVTVDDIVHSEHTNLEESVKKKKKHRHKDERTLVEHVSEHELPYNIAIDNTAVFDDIINDEHTNVEESTRKKKKKKHKDESTLVENVSEHETSLNQNMSVNNTGGFGDHLRSEHASLEESMRKKKKRHLKDKSIVVENVSEHEISYKNNIAIDQADGSDVILHSEHIHLGQSERKKKKHRLEGERTLVENSSEHEISYNIPFDNTNVEESARKKKKKKKHHHEGEETFLENASEHEISYNITIDKTHLEQSARKKKKKHCREGERTLVENVSEHKVSSNENIAVDETNVLDDFLHSEPNNLEEPVRKKKKKKKKHSLEDDGTSVENVSGHTNLTESPREKKKKHRNVDGETCSNNSISENHTKENAEELAEADMCASSQKSHKGDKKKRKSGLPMEETSEVPEHLVDVDCHLNEISTSEEASLNVDAQESVRKKKRKKPRQEEDTVVVDVLPPIKGNNPEKASKKQKKKNLSEDGMSLGTESLTSEKDDVYNNNLDQTTENECQTESSMFERFKQGITSCKIENERSESTAESEMDKENRTKELTPSQKPSKKRCLQSTSEILHSLRTRDLKLLEEYYPQIWSYGAGSVRDLIYCDLGRIKKAKLKGIMFRTGRFDHQEDELIKKNVNEFANLIGVETPEILFHVYRFPEMKTIVTKLKREYHFMHRIADGLYRNLHDVYGRGLKLFDLSGKKGRFSPEEVQVLREQCEMHGKDWNVIAVATGRSKANTQLKASQLRREVNRGLWSNDEVNTLIQAVKNFILKEKQNPGEELVMVSKDMLFKGISWTFVEEQVQTRNWTHCKSKWNDLMVMRMNDGVSPFKGYLGLQTKIRIIQWLHTAEIQRDIVNWDELGNFVGNIPPGIIQRRVYRLKIGHVPDWRKLTFKEIVDYLYTEVLPKFEEMLEAWLQTEQILPELPKRKDEFLISEIFRKYTDRERERES